MNIVFPRYIGWKLVFTSQDPNGSFGKSTNRQITRSLALLNEYGYEFRIEEVNEKYIDKFVPIYEKNILSKKRGTVFPVKERILTTQKQGKRYGAISLFKQEEYLGGLIFSIDEDSKSLSGAYRAFPHSISEYKKTINISLVSDLRFFEYAISLGFQMITHGQQDRNIYGYHSSIGLACYKTQIGCRPYVTSEHTWTHESNEFLHTIPAYDEDMLIFLGEKSGEYISEALLISEKPEEELKKEFPILFSNQYFETSVVKHSAVPVNPDWK